MPDLKDFTPLNRAACEAKSNIASMLLAYGADGAATEDEIKPLKIAVMRNSHAVAGILLDEVASLRNCPEITSTFPGALPASRCPLPAKAQTVWPLRAAGSVLKCENYLKTTPKEGVAKGSEKKGTTKDTKSTKKSFSFPL